MTVPPSHAPDAVQHSFEGGDFALQLFAAAGVMR
jgi:hypothetical protein